ncbi:MAG: type IV pilin N-terminal domain-containing protein [Methanomicrobiaceae archaeon]|nr:type IV pilin N-terminal domain-containing protein [Methanomicrobiaceae archaeon]
MKKDDAVSPVVGVMLMLVVTIIIAAVVSAFAGGLASSEQKAPTLAMETKITNTGYYYGSHMIMNVIAASEPIPGSDVKIVTTWRASNGVKNTSTVLPDVANTNYGTTILVAPWGYGPGIEEFGMYNTKTVEQNFGNYTLTAGTSMRAYPSGAWGPTSDPETYGGYGPGPDPTYEYVTGEGYVIGQDCDGMQALLGIDWNNLHDGDVVNVQVIHTPSGKKIYNEDVVVRGG